MTSYTTELDIPYPDPADSACTVADAMEAAADVIGPLLESILSNLRDVVNNPMFMVSLAPGGIIRNYYVYTHEDEFLTEYDTVDFDPNGIVDLQRDNLTVLIPDSGLVIMGAYIMISGMPADTRSSIYPFNRTDIGNSMFIGTSGSTDPAGGYMMAYAQKPYGDISARYRNWSSTAYGTSVRSSMWGIRLSRTLP